MPFPTAQIGDVVIFFDGTKQLPAVVTSDDTGSGVVAMNVNFGNPAGEVVLKLAPYDATGLRADSWMWPPGGTPFFPPATSWYDIRTYGAIPGVAGQTATTNALNTIFNTISYGYFPTVNPPTSVAVVYIPTTAEDGWWVGDLDPYVGNPGATIFIKGDTWSGRNGVSGSTLIFNGTDGGTVLDLVAVNNSNIENITINMNNKALVGLKTRQFWNAAHSTQVGSSGVLARNVFINSPKGDRNSILWQAGEDDDPPNTLQASEYRGENIFLQGHSTIPGWGFRAMVGGNTKNFRFYNLNYGYLYRVVDVMSGYLVINELNGGNIGYDSDEASACVFVGNCPTTIIGSAMENGGTGFMSRLVYAGQDTPVMVAGSYFDGNTPPDDYFIKSAGYIDLRDCFAHNGRQISQNIAWTALSPILAGQYRSNDSGKLYVCTVPGTTGNSGGPTGTGTNIADGSIVKWNYVTSSDGNVAKIQATSAELGGHGTCIVENVTLPYISTPITAVPIYDGSNNPLGPTITPADSGDYARGIQHAVYVRGNRTGIFGSNYNQILPSGDGQVIIAQHDQFLTDVIVTDNNGITVARNDTGVVVLTVPASTLAAAGSGSIRLGQMPAGYRIDDALINVTTGFSGPSVTGIKLEMGGGSNANDILIASDVTVTGTVVGLAGGTDRGTGWDSNRYIIPLNGSTEFVALKCTITGGSISNINAGSADVYLQFSRLKV